MIGFYTNFYCGEKELKPHPFVEIAKGEEYLSSNFLTIIITTYNRSSLLKEAIHSLMLQKTTKGFNILITDNNSDENHQLSYEYIAGLEKKNIRYIRNHNNWGMFGNMNQGLVLAETEYVSFLHDDDLYDENFVTEVWNLVSKNQYIDALHVGVTKIINGKKGTIESKENLKALKDWQMLFEGPGAPTGLVVKRKVAVDLGGFNTTFHPTSDYCFGCMISSKSNYYKYSKTLCYYRVSENESMRAETLKLFVNNDYYLRNYILKRYHICDSVIRKIQGYFVEDQVKVLRANYNKDFVFEIPKEYTIERNVGYFKYLMCRFYIEFAIRIRTIFK